MVQVSAEEAKKRLPDLIAEAMKGETVVIQGDQGIMVQLVPVSVAKGNRQPGTARDLISISDDFDEPLEDFKEYTG
jgi:antitoxin (DNA-binding transcriptional repressor) of toxin-antitoxin stability system